MPSEQDASGDCALPSHAGGLAGSGNLDRLVDTARDYAKTSTAENTHKGGDRPIRTSR